MFLIFIYYFFVHESFFSYEIEIWFRMKSFKKLQKIKFYKCEKCVESNALLYDFLKCFFCFLNLSKGCLKDIYKDDLIPNQNNA